jgi:hypothetical protein
MISDINPAKWVYCLSLASRPVRKIGRKAHNSRFFLTEIVAESIPAAFYCFSFAPNLDFSQLFPKEQEILLYINYAATRYKATDNFFVTQSGIIGNQQKSPRTGRHGRRTIESLDTPAASHGEEFNVGYVTKTIRKGKF